MTGKKWWTWYFQWPMMNMIFSMTNDEHDMFNDKWWTWYVQWQTINMIFSMTNGEHNIFNDKWWTWYFQWPMMNMIFSMTNATNSFLTFTLLCCIQVKKCDICPHKWQQHDYLEKSKAMLSFILNYFSFLSVQAIWKNGKMYFVHICRFQYLASV